MKALMIICLPIFFSHVGLAVVDDFDVRCEQRHGTLIKSWTCPNSGKVRNEMFCKMSDSNGVPMIFNGCSASFGGYDKIFFEPCVAHDLCYHHEPVSSGLQKYDCDQKFYDNMVAVCQTQTGAEQDCLSTAKWFFRAVQIGGDSSWNCSKEKANYLSSLFE